MSNPQPAPREPSATGPRAVQPSLGERLAPPEPQARPGRVDGAVDDELLEMVRRIESHPDNAPGADKTWVLVRMRRIERLFRRNRELHGGPPLEELRQILAALKHD